MTERERKLVLEGIVGSQAYGLARPDSDEDKLGVYLAPAVSFLGIHIPLDKNATWTSKNPDVTHHELRKYLRLCLACNPTVMELMWLTEGGYTVRTPLGDELASLRSAVLSRRRVEDAYLGYATQQFERLGRKGRFPDVPLDRVEKHARHMMRLIRQGVGLWQTGYLELRVNDPEEYFEFGREVAAGERDRPEMLLSWARSVFSSERSALPEVPDEARVDAWVKQVRLAEITGR